jgi:hypothetical protein
MFRWLGKAIILTFIILLFTLVQCVVPVVNNAERSDPSDSRVTNGTAITSFTFPVSTRTLILGQEITLFVPIGTNVTALVPSIVITGQSVSPASGVLQNYTDPVEYIVTSSQDTTEDYTVTVIEAFVMDFDTAPVHSYTSYFPAAAGGLAADKWNFDASSPSFAMQGESKIRMALLAPDGKKISVNHAADFYLEVVYGSGAGDGSGSYEWIGLSQSPPVSPGYTGYFINVGGSGFGWIMSNFSLSDPAFSFAGILLTVDISAISSGVQSYSRDKGIVQFEYNTAVDSDPGTFSLMEDL